MTPFQDRFYAYFIVFMLFYTHGITEIETYRHYLVEGGQKRNSEKTA